jgi:TPR repeat protein
MLGTWTAGVLLSKDTDGFYYVEDVQRDRLSSGNRNKLMHTMANLDGLATVIRIEQEPGSGGKESAEISIKDLAGYTVKTVAEAAVGGVPQAQYFLGNAYRTGQGIEKNGTLAVYWWTKAVEFGSQPALSALSLFRRQALSQAQQEQGRLEALKAFQGYREKLWEDFPDLTRNSDNETVGTTLLKLNRADYAVSVLLQEGYALSEVAQTALAQLYGTGWEQHLPPFDKNILTCFETTAGEGFGPAKKILARIYGKGLGMKPDRQKANKVLRGLSKNEIKAILTELSLEP